MVISLNIKNKWIESGRKFLEIVIIELKYYVDVFVKVNNCIKLIVYK